MNKRSKEIIEDAFSQGKWTWLEIDSNSDSLYLEFEKLRFISRLVINQLYDLSNTNYEQDHRGELAIRFGQNLYFFLFYNETEDLDFLDLDNEYLERLLSGDEKITDENSYFFKNFELDVKNFKFQDLELKMDLIRRFKNRKVLIDSSQNQNYDFFLCFECENIAAILGGDMINFFNDYDALNDDEIKRISNNWYMYYMDYWNKKGSEKEYELDLLCEEIPLK
ncbi:hypothetical protein [uncultured Methanobrevibacter sp.]|uniref:hypothetical protein n=1 Tax=uncultured Methanobrevibacter sp. TaxID=253161 RepID=UPI00260D8570